MIPTRWWLVAVAVALIVGGFAGHCYRDSQAKAWAAAVARDRTGERLVFRATIDSLTGLEARSDTVTIREAAIATGIRATRDRLTQPDTTMRDSLRYQTARADLAVQEAEHWEGAYLAGQTTLGLVREQQAASLARIGELERLLDEGEKIVAGPRRKLFGLLPLPRCGVGAALTTDGKVRPAVACVFTL